MTVATGLLLLAPPAALADNAPAVSSEEASEVGVTTAKLSGEVNPNGAPGEPSNTTWHIQYRAVGSEEWAQAAEGTILEPESEDSKNPVTVETLLGFGGELKAGSEYQFRIVAENGTGTAHTPSPVSFTMDAPNPPALTIEAASAVGYTGATLHATLNPQGGNLNVIAEEVLPIQWQLQYSTDGIGWSNANPLSPEFIEGEAAKGEGPTGDIALEAEIPAGTLQPAQAYRTRLHVLYASIPFGLQPIEAESSEGEFTTEAVAAPVLGAPQASAITDSAAHLSGAVEVTGTDEAFYASCRFEYLTQAEWENNGNAFPEPNGAPSVSCSPNPVTGSEPQPVAVQADIFGLQPNTTYHLRLVASNAGGQTATPAALTFATDAILPEVATGTNTPKASGETLVRAYVNPYSSAITECVFEYGPTTSYGQTAPCESAPTTGIEAVMVTAHIEGLEPGVTYHYQVSATNTAGTVTSKDGVFTSFEEESHPNCPNADKPGANFLPDCRAWEQVSPSEKNGGEIMADSSRTRAAADGSAIAYVSRNSFGQVNSAALSNDYIAQRASDTDSGNSGWSTHGISPQLPNLPTRFVVPGGEPRYLGEFSDDLSSGIFLNWGALNSEQSVAGVTNLYLRTDLRSPGPGTYRLVSECPLCGESAPLPALPDTPRFTNLQPVLAAVSPDSHHVLFESRLRLTADAPLQPLGSIPIKCDMSVPLGKCRARLYEWDQGTLRLVGRVPLLPATTCADGGGAACVAADVSIAGQGAGGSRSNIGPTPHVLSDGSDGHIRAFFTQPTDAEGETSEGVSISPPTVQNNINASRSGRIYMRIDGHETVQLNVSERTTCAVELGGTPPCEPALAPFAPAQFLDASVDGTHAFFRTTQPLTDDAPEDGQQKIYMYDTTLPPSDPHKLTLLSRDQQPVDESNVLGLIGVSDDGNTVYFIAAGQLVGGLPHTTIGVYRWHEGVLSYVGSMDTDYGENTTTGADIGTRLQARVSPDGRFLLLAARSGLTGNDPGTCEFGCRELYIFDADRQTLICASCPPPGVTAESDATAAFRSPSSVGATNPDLHVNHPIADDGSRVFFSSGEALVDEDTNGAFDAYQYDVRTGTLALLSSGTDEDNSYFLDASAMGYDAFFLTGQRLVGWDTDGSIDLYDARIAGGFPQPPSVTLPCTGESCRAVASMAPAGSSTSSSQFSGPGNTHVRRCPSGRRLTHAGGGRSRCVKRRHHRRTASHHRGGSR